MEEKEKDSFSNAVSNNIQVGTNKAKDIFSRYIGLIIAVLGGLVVFFILVFVDTSTNTNIGIKEQFFKPLFWICFMITAIVTISVSIVSYNTAKKETKETDKFVGTMEYYSQQKGKIMPYVDNLFKFCEVKNNEARLMLEKSFVSNAGLTWEQYTDANFDIEKLEKWQKKIIKKINKIKVKPLTPKDLLQEENEQSPTNYHMLVQSEKSASNKFIVRKSLFKVAMVFVTSLTFSLNFALGNWINALISAFMVIIGYVTSMISGHTYVLNELRQRFIGKGDYLCEYSMNVEKYREKPQSTEVVLYETLEVKKVDPTDTKQIENKEKEQEKVEGNTNETSNTIN